MIKYNNGSHEDGIITSMSTDYKNKHRFLTTIMHQTVPHTYGMRRKWSMDEIIAYIGDGGWAMKILRSFK